MTDDADRTAHMEAFDSEAAQPRTGWTQEEQGVELWTKDAAGLRGYVMGLPASEELEAGYWQFRVVDMENEQIVGSGHSSRRDGRWMEPIAVFHRSTDGTRGADAGQGSDVRGWPPG